MSPTDAENRDALTVASKAEITIEGLLANGYREFVPSALLKCDRAFQKAVSAGGHTKYFVNVQYYDNTPVNCAAFEARVCCDTNTGGYAWLNFKEDTIAAIESRAEALWQAAGSVVYE